MPIRGDARFWSSFWSFALPVLEQSWVLGGTMDTACIRIYCWQIGAHAIQVLVSNGVSTL